MNTNAIYNLNDIPLFTYGMIGVATLGLALITMNIENDSFAKDEGYEKIKSKKSGGDYFGFKSSEQPTENKSSIFDVFGSKLSEQPTENKSSIFDVFGSKSPEEQKKEETNLISNMFTLKKQGGKYNKTKHNKKHSVYTRKR